MNVGSIVDISNRFYGSNNPKIIKYVDKSGMPLLLYLSRIKALIQEGDFKTVVVLCNAMKLNPKIEIRKVAMTILSTIAAYEFHKEKSIELYESVNLEFNTSVEDIIIDMRALHQLMCDYSCVEKPCVPCDIVSRILS